MSYGTTQPTQSGPNYYGAMLNQYPVGQPGAGGKAPDASPSFGQGMDYTQMQNNGGAPGTGGKGPVPMGLGGPNGQPGQGMVGQFDNSGNLIPGTGGVGNPNGPGMTTPGAGGKMNIDQFGQAIGASPEEMAQAKQDAFQQTGYNPADFSGPGLAGKSGGIDLLSPIADAVNATIQPANPSINAMAPSAPSGRSPGAPLTGNFQPTGQNIGTAVQAPGPARNRLAIQPGPLGLPTSPALNPAAQRQAAMAAQARGLGINPTPAPRVVGRPASRAVAPTARPMPVRRGAGRGGMIR